MTGGHAAGPSGSPHPRALTRGASVLVLGGGPDAEREVSLESSRSVARALESAGIPVRYEVIDQPTAMQLAGMPGDVVVPVLHGPYGEGGPLQDLLDRGGRPYVGCGPTAARVCMDKVASKLHASAIGVATAAAAVFNPRDTTPPIDPPVVIKPIHEGSSVGVHLCHTRAAWEAALPRVIDDLRAHESRPYMVERLITGHELTVGVLDPSSDGAVALPPIRIEPAAEFYDYHAKYTRDDTRYTVDPTLAPGVSDRIRREALSLARAVGVRHLCRVDFLLDHDHQPWFLELNTMPGFTGHSLLPMAARHTGLDMPILCAMLVGWAIRDQQPMN
ncbi:MAG: D-alanine--D-alanine ligase [Phycisphaeraceae bacterium]|nr:D-alanine--D-alanine ligase [Phycisphaerae bacterium]MBX3393457.1 D-alanine--D-alanine ligase [Phycisphaeraceae bacterium]HRJ50311.1 D-alanine--D-alanine ligase [Phycisphaerales bacterium]